MRLALRCLLAASALAAGCGVDGPPKQCPSQLRPSARSQVTPILVPETNQIYALGGLTATGPLDELWRYSFGSCGGWERLTLASSPGPRATYAAAYDDLRHRIVYIGGAATNDVWALDTERLTFTKLVTVGTTPLAATAQVAAYDELHDRIVFAGVESYTIDFATSDQGQWMFLDPTTLAAPASSVIDPTRSMLLVLDPSGLRAYSFLTGTWHDVTLGGEALPANARLAWDAVGKSVVAIGDGVFYGALDAGATQATFSRFATSGDPPSRHDFAVVLTGNLVWLFGGATATGCMLDDLWTLDLQSGVWTNVWPATTCL